MEYLLHIAILVGIFAILSMSLNLLSGYTGLISVAHAGFFGIGAYVAALFSTHFHTPILANMASAVLIAFLVGVLVGIPSLRLRGDYFVVATFSLQVIAFDVFNNLVSITGGPLGVAGIPPPSLFGFTVSSQWGFLVLVASICTATFLVVGGLVRSPFGRVLMAMREDEIVAQVAGKDVASFKLTVFATSSGLAAVAGVLFAHYIGFIDPTSFTVADSIFLISLVIIGGAGSLSGPVIGAAILVALPELLRFAGMPSSIAANIRQIMVGAFIIAFMIWLPRGFAGGYAFERREQK